MNKERRHLAFAAVALATTLALVAAPARADDAVESKKLVQAAEKTVNDFAGNKDFPTFGPALAKAKAVLIFPEILKAGFILGGSGGSGVPHPKLRSSRERRALP